MSATEGTRTIAFVNADIAAFGRGVLRVQGDRIVSIGVRESRADLVVDLAGDRLLPGLVNAHDHLHRNHYPRLKYRARYDNASAWAADIDARRHDDALLTAGALVPRTDSLMFGALKNLLSGATTVMHHDAPFPDFAAPGFPVRVVARYGWAHSLASGAEHLRESHAATPEDVPWFIHAGEGTDAAAADELRQLDALQLLTPNTVIVHGVAFDAAAHARLLERRVGLVWCPSSNYFLYGQAAATGELARAGLLALGSDSRLSGERDLLEELQFARRTGDVDDALLEPLVTSQAARLLRVPGCGSLRAGACADLIVLPRDARLWELRRADLRCVIASGALRCGDRDYADRLLDPALHVPVAIDGRPKVFDAALAGLLGRLAIREPGIELIAGAERAA